MGGGGGKAGSRRMNKCNVKNSHNKTIISHISSHDKAILTNGGRAVVVIYVINIIY
jgi:hypothetical protein